MFFQLFIQTAYPAVSGSPSPSSAAGSAAGWPSSTAPSAPLCSSLSAPQVTPSWTALHFPQLPPGPRILDPPLDRNPLVLRDTRDYITLETGNAAASQEWRKSSRDNNTMVNNHDRGSSCYEKSFIIDQHMYGGYIGLNSRAFLGKNEMHDVKQTFFTH